jgi:hypothetical protein
MRLRNTIHLSLSLSLSLCLVITIASEYLYEKIGAQLKSTYDDLTIEIQVQEEHAIEE